MYNLSAASSVAQKLFISSLDVDAGSITLSEASKATFDEQDVSLWANDRLELLSGSQLELVAGAGFTLSLQSNKYCLMDATSALDLASSTTIRS